MANLKNTTISGTGHITPPVTTTWTRPLLTTTIVKWTGSGYTVVTGNTPTASASSWTAPAGVTAVEVLVVAGGGGGGGGFDTWAGGGGGGAGGLIYKSAYPVTPGNSYSITVGTGGAGGLGDATPRYGGSGTDSVFDTLTAKGGGGGNAWNSSTGSTAPAGGSGGGGQNSSGPFTGAAGTAGQGNAGGDGMTYSGSNASSCAGGGGAGGVGGRPASNTGGGGGQGLYFDIAGSRAVYAAGGGGGGGVYGGGSQNGGVGGNGSGSNGTSATANTGGGGGGAGSTITAQASKTNGGAGGSGIVVLRYVQTSDNSDLRGSLRYNSEVTDLEVYENNLTQWSTRDQSKNFAGHNLASYSETMNIGGWSFVSITATGTTIAPDGISTAIGIAETATAAQHLLNFTISGGTTTVGSIYCWSGYFKINTNVTQIILHTNGEGTMTFNLSGNGSLGGSLNTNVINAGIQLVGNGWYRCFATFRKTTTGVTFYVANQNGLGVYSGSTSTNYYAWGLQIEQDVLTPGPYTKTVTANAAAPGVQGNYRIHKYTNVGTSSFVPATTGFVDVLVVGGGAAGGNSIYGSGGGGGGGVIYQRNYPVIAGKQYTVTVGAGGTSGNIGDNSQFGTLIAIGGGNVNRAGGSGGGGGHSNPGFPGTAGTVGQGHPGGMMVYVSPYPCGGGGGAGGCGQDGSVAGGGGNGGPGIPIDITGSTQYYGGGGGGCPYQSTTGVQSGLGGIGGGGNAVWAGTGVAGTNGLGGGGGAGGGNGVGGGSGAGGSGVVIVRYRYN